jgi:hypothetical protein
MLSAAFCDNRRAVGSEMKWHCPGEHVYFAFLGEAIVLVSVEYLRTHSFTVFEGILSFLSFFFLLLSIQPGDLLLLSLPQAASTLPPMFHMFGLLWV